MKRIQKNTRLILAGSLGMLVLLYACGKNFLSKPPIGPLAAPALANKAGVDGLLIGAYSLLDGLGGNGGGWAASSDNWVYGGVAADDAYKGSTASDQGDIQALEIWTATSTNSYPDGKFASIYDGINRANAVLKNMRLVSSLSAADTTEFAGEARFLRGYYHFEGVRMWGKVPYIDEAANNGNVLTYTNKNDITPNIIDDFTFAMNNLPATQSQDGRANKYAAEALLAKVYMYQLNYTAALPLLNDLINNGVTAKGDKYALVPFTYNFNPATKNSAECIFAVQMSVNDGSAATGTPNGNYGDALNFPYGGGPGACCGFNNPSQSVVNAFKTDANGLPLLDGSYNTLGQDIRQAHTPVYAGSLDPRVDWTAGREGVPYLDWGLHPGDAWIRDAGQDGHFNPKKTVYAKAQQGSLSDGTGTYWASTEITANNYAIVRFADVLLWAAEALIGSGGDASLAESYVNQIRTRAATTNYWVYVNKDGTVPNFSTATYFYTQSANTVPADNYKISPYPAGAFADPVYALKAIQMERRLELSQEGHRFFDLQRWDKASPGFMANSLNAYAAYEASIGRSEYGPPVVTFTKGKNEVFAIPQSQIDAEGLPGGGSALTQNPGY